MFSNGAPQGEARKAEACFLLNAVLPEERKRQGGPAAQEIGRDLRPWAGWKVKQSPRGRRGRQRLRAPGSVHGPRMCERNGPEAELLRALQFGHVFDVDFNISRTKASSREKTQIVR